MPTPEETLAAMMANLPEKTGKPLDEWLRIVASTGLAKHGEIVKYLQSEHGITHGFTNQIALRALAAAEPSPSAARQGRSMPLPCHIGSFIRLRRPPFQPDPRRGRGRAYSVGGGVVGQGTRMLQQRAPVLLQLVFEAAPWTRARSFSIKQRRVSR